MTDACNKIFTCTILTWLALCHLQSRDSEGPQITAVVVRRIGILIAGYNLWSHPVWCANECVPATDRLVQLSADSKVNCVKKKIKMVVKLCSTVPDLLNNTVTSLRD